MVEQVNIRTLEKLVAMSAGERKVQLLKLRTLAYSTDLLPSELVLEYELAQYEHGVGKYRDHSVSTSGRSDLNMLRHIN